MFDIITIGSATRDVYIRNPHVTYLKSRAFKTGAGICFDLGSKIGIDELYFTTGGSAVNTAISFSRLGLNAAALARVGSDAGGRELVKILHEEGVNTAFFQHDKRDGTAYSLLFLAPSGERTILTYRGATEKVARREIHWDKLKTRWFYIGHLAGKSKSLFKPFIDFAARKGIQVALNPGITQLKNSESWWRGILTKVDILIVNREEASYLTRIPYKDEYAIFKKLDAWVRGIVVITEGPRGVLVSDGVQRWRGGILKERYVSDRTGAGDAFGAGFVAAFIERDIPCEKGVCHPRKNDIAYALQLASANATSQIEHLGSRDGLLRKRTSIYRWGKLKVGHIIHR